MRGENEQAHESRYSVCLQANLRTCCRQGSLSTTLPKITLAGARLLRCRWRRSLASPKKEGKKEENQQAAKTRSASSPAKAAADGFHLGSVEFCQFRCFHILVLCFLVTLGERYNESIRRTEGREKSRIWKSDEGGLCRGEWLKGEEFLTILRNHKIISSGPKGAPIGKVFRNACSSLDGIA